MDGPEKIEPPAGETAGSSEKHFDTRINNINRREIELPLRPSQSEFRGYPPPEGENPVSTYFDDALNRPQWSPQLRDIGIARDQIVCIRINVPVARFSLRILGLAQQILGQTPLSGAEQRPADLLFYRTSDPIRALRTRNFYLGQNRMQVEIIPYYELFATSCRFLEKRDGYRWVGHNPRDLMVSELPIASSAQFETFLDSVTNVFREHGARDVPWDAPTIRGCPSEITIRSALAGMLCDNFISWFPTGCVLAKVFEDAPEVGAGIFNDFVAKCPLYQGSSYARDCYDSYCDDAPWWDEFVEIGDEPTAPEFGDSPLSVEPMGTAIDPGLFERVPQEWSEPKPIVTELRPVPAFDADVLMPPVFRDWVMDEAERMPCPPVYVAAAAFVGAGSIIGASCGVRPKRHDPWTVKPNLWGAIVGDPGAKKSPAWSAGMKPLDRLSAKAVETYRTQLLAHEINSVIKKTRKDAIKSQFKHPENLDDGAIDKLKQEYGALDSEGAPTLRRFRTNDCTVEKLGELLRDNPNGMCAVRDELVGLLARWEREGGEGEKAFYLECWNGYGSFDFDRIGRGHIHIENTCLGVFGGIQPDKLAGYLELVTQALGNDGMLQRFQVLVYPDAVSWEWRDRPPNAVARDAASAVFEKLAEFDPVDLGATVTGPYDKRPAFQFDDEAQAYYIEWSTDLHQNRIPAEDNPLIQQHLAKYDKLFPALALIFHLVDCAAHGARGPITAGAARRAGAWCEYLEAHARRCYGLLKEVGQRAAQALAAKLRSGALQDGFTAREVVQKDWRGLTTSDAVQAGLDVLEDLGWLRGEETAKPRRIGRPTTRYRINPLVPRAPPK